MAKYDPRLTLATLAGLTSRISLKSHQIGMHGKAFIVPLNLAKSDYERRRISEERVDAIRKLHEIEADVKLLRKTLLLMERQSSNMSLEDHADGVKRVKGAMKEESDA